MGGLKNKITDKLLNDEWIKTKITDKWLGLCDGLVLFICLFLLLFFFFLIFYELLGSEDLTGTTNWPLKSPTMGICLVTLHVALQLSFCLAHKTMIYIKLLNTPFTKTWCWICNQLEVGFFIDISYGSKIQKCKWGILFLIIK